MRTKRINPRMKPPVQFLNLKIDSRFERKLGLTPIKDFIALLKNSKNSPYGNIEDL